MECTVNDVLHKSVLLEQSISALNIKENSQVVDATFGRGGHSKAILEKLGKQGRLLVIDKDLEAIACAEALAQKDDRISVHHGSFDNIKRYAEQLGMMQLDGVLLDLGVCSTQIDCSERGFSYMQDGPLDMRMNQSEGLTASQWINQAEVSELRRVIATYGEERFASRIAKAIAAYRIRKPIDTTHELVSIIESAQPYQDKFTHPAARTFQAIRIYINQELQELETVLSSAFDLLGPSGRLVVISFHSLEDRIAKHFMQQKSNVDAALRMLPVIPDELLPKGRIIGSIVKASESERVHNVRSKSAILRVLEKVV